MDYTDHTLHMHTCITNVHFFYIKSEELDRKKGGKESQGLAKIFGSKKCSARIFIEIIF